jgi:hypothetical protein
MSLIKFRLRHTQLRMVKLPFLRKTPFQVLGVPSYATAEEIHSAYLKRLEALKPYRFDKSQEHEQWTAVNEIVEELHQAYANLLSFRPARKFSMTSPSAQPLYQLSPAPAFSPLDASAPPVEPPAPSSVPPQPSPETVEPLVSHREVAEQAVRAYKKLSFNGDDLEARTKFIELIATRGFSDSQQLPKLPHRTQSRPAKTGT